MKMDAMMEINTYTKLMFNDHVFVDRSVFTSLTNSLVNLVEVTS